MFEPQSGVSRSRVVMGSAAKRSRLPMWCSCAIAAIYTLVALWWLHYATINRQSSPVASQWSCAGDSESLWSALCCGDLFRRVSWQPP